MDQNEQSLFRRIIEELHSIAMSARDFGRSHRVATKEDLLQLESNLLKAITENKMAESDQAALNALLKRSNRIAARLQALDSKTQPK